MTLLTLFIVATTLSAAPKASRVLILPVKHEASITAGNMLAQRLAVALSATKKLEAVTITDVDAFIATRRLQDVVGCLEPACLGQVGAVLNVEQIIASELVRDGATFTWFITAFDAASGVPRKRREFARLHDKDLSGPVAVTAAAFLSGAAHLVPRRLSLAVEVVSSAPIPTSVVKSLERALIGSLAAIENVSVPSPIDSQNSVASSHRVLVTIDSFSLVTERHHVHDYRDGMMQATLQLMGDGRVFFSKTLTVTDSQRQRHSTNEQVIATLIERLNQAWMGSLHGQGFPNALLTGNGIQ